LKLLIIANCLPDQLLLLLCSPDLQRTIRMSDPLAEAQSLETMERWTGEVLTLKELRKAQKREKKAAANGGGETAGDGDDNDATPGAPTPIDDSASALAVDQRFPVDIELNRKIILW
jgi:hypothetical protein